jgi:hypothetical protein
MSGQRISFAGYGAGDDARDVETILRAGAAFRRDGMIVLDDLVDPRVVERARAAIERGHPDYIERDPERSFGLYPGRFTLPLPLRGALADRALLCPPAVRSLLDRLLGDAYVMDSSGVLVSLPEAEDQSWHPDALLFPELPIDRLLPPVAVAFSLPLVRMDEISGSTGFRVGSHVAPDKNVLEFAPVVPVGSALLWDFRVTHRGLANRSNRPRPVAFTVFCRDWWVETAPREAIHYEKLTVARSVAATFDKGMHRIMSRAKVID